MDAAVRSACAPSGSGDTWSSVEWKAVGRQVYRLQVCIAKAVREKRCETLLAYFSWVPLGAFEGLEPYEVKVSRTVLRGPGAGDRPRLPGMAGDDFPMYDREVENHDKAVS